MYRQASLSTVKNNFKAYLSSKINNSCVMIIVRDQNTRWRINTIHFNSFFQVSLVKKKTNFQNYSKLRGPQGVETVTVLGTLQTSFQTLNLFLQYLPYLKSLLKKLHVRHQLNWVSQINSHVLFFLHWLLSTNNSIRYIASCKWYCSDIVTEKNLDSIQIQKAE